MLAIGNERQFAAFCKVAGCAQVTSDPRFANNAARVGNRHALIAQLVPILKSRPTSDWVSRLVAVHVPCGPINDLAQVFSEPQVRHRELQLSLPHSSAGRAPGVRNPIRLSRTPLQHERSAPLLGEHTDSVLAERLGLSAPELRALHDRGVLK
jgi:crotonobetainyl-CoA:carnitine CoA-transferase CaiB-like acyl-CoA transferase